MRATAAAAAAFAVVAVAATLVAASAVGPRSDSPASTARGAAAPATVAGKRVTKLVLLQLENRSFDSLLGWLLGTISNNTCIPADPTNATAPMVCAGRDAALVPFFDPGHSLSNTAQQVFGVVPNASSPALPETMNGFVVDAATVAGAALAPSIMQALDPMHVPVFTALASQFTVGAYLCAAGPSRGRSMRAPAHPHAPRSERVRFNPLGNLSQPVVNAVGHVARLRCQRQAPDAAGVAAAAHFPAAGRDRRGVGVLLQRRADGGAVHVHARSL